MNKNILLLVMMLVGLEGYASPLWMRYPAISPDGREIAFSYQGDIYKVGVDGGMAVQLTTHPAYDFRPVWSPDGTQIAFATDRYGNFDIFVMPSVGGEPKRLTTHSAPEIPYAFTTDGKSVVYGAQIQDPVQNVLFPHSSMTELYRVSLEGGRPEQILATPAEEVCFAADGKSFVYQDQKGFESAWRKHHTSSVTRDIWLYDMTSGKHTQLVDWAGEDRQPVFAPGDKQVYFLSERAGTFNVFSFPLSDPKEVHQETFFKVNPVRFLSIADNGTLCFGYDGEIYVKKEGAEPQKVAVQVVNEQSVDNNEYLSFSSGADDAAVSPDGKQVALILRGEVFVTSTDYLTTKQVSKTPEREEGLSFAPDNRTLAYASERDGNWNIYIAKIGRKEDPNFPNATVIEEEALFKPSSTERSLPQFSPDGKELAYIEDRSRLMVVNLETKKTRQITDGSKQYDTGGNIPFKWSPDGKWFAMEYTGNRHDPYSDVGLVSASGNGEIINLTNSGYTDSNPRWVMDGNAILFISERYGMRNHASWGSLNDVMIVFLNQGAYDKFRLNKEDYELWKEASKSDESESGENKKKEIVVDLKNIEDRIVRLTPNSSMLGDAVIDKDGGKLYYMAAFEGGYDLWQSDLREHSTKLINKLNGSWASLDLKGDDLFVLGNSITKIKLGSGEQKPVAYKAVMELDKGRERAYMFDHVCRQEAKCFYTESMHGVDWPLMRRTYEKFLPYINNNYDFSELLSEMLGELNVSHTGGRYYPEASGDVTAELGVLLDWNYDKDGLLIGEILEKGPFDKADLKVKAGDVIEKIDGVQIRNGADFYPYLNKKAGRKVLIAVYRPADGTRWEEVVTPVTRSAQNNLLYIRWVKQRAADVERLSGGRLGYVHIQSMGDPSFRSVYSDILGKYNDKEGIVIDTRFNGGGRLHEDVEVLFSGEKYLTQVIRGREACDMPSRRWNKPSVMLMCEANYSNAHGTPWVYKHKGIGKLVGMPVAGTMTTVSWETLQDPTLIFGIPVVGYRLADGSYLENQQLEPDVKVANAPETVVKGDDSQLKAAVQTLLDELDNKR